MPTTGAMRAARDSVNEMLFTEERAPEKVIANIAAIIDRETGAGELIEAIENLETAIYRLCGDDLPGWVSGYIVDARAAIAKYKGE